MKQIKNQDAPQYFEQGYAVFPSLLDDADLETLRKTCDDLLSEPPDDDLGGKGHNIGRGHDRRFLRHRHKDFPDLEKFILGSEMKSFLQNFIGDEPHLFNEQFVVKGAKSGASFAWHQDSGYIEFKHKPYITVWIALDDTTIENGAVYVLPQKLDDDTPFIKHWWDENGKEYVGYDGDDPGVPAIVPAGSVVVFSSLTLHRSSSNVTNNPRRAYIAQYSAEPIRDPETGKNRRFATAL